MKTIFIILLCGLVVFSHSIQESSAKSAYNIKYETTGQKFTAVPTLCALEPQKDPTMPENIIPQMMKSTRASIDAWIGPLKSSSPRDSKWDVNYVVVGRDKQANYDYSKCDVTISFTKTPPKAESTEILGLQYHKNGKNYVEIFYQGYGICEQLTDVWQIWYTCESNSPKLIDSMEAILRHEIGHALGLGHYVSEETGYLMGNVTPPSIMVPIIDLIASPIAVPMDPADLQIMPVDIQKLKEIYGNKGWGYKSQNVNNDKNTMAKLDSTKIKKIQLKRGVTITDKISGSVPIDLYKKGHPADVTVVAPDGSTKILKILVTNKRVFEHTFKMTDTTTPGKYQMTITYFGKEIKKIAYDVVKIK
ncbi:MAG: hypothetical protein ACREAX_02355 [Candidatus Nitrosotenuis sp.]